MKNEGYNRTLNNYYYQEQIRKYLIQFMAIFSGLQVSVGEGGDLEKRQTNLVKVPIIQGSKDRVVAALLASNSPNVPIRLPAMAAHITGIQLAVDRMKGQGTHHTHKYFPRGGVFPDDLKTVKKLMPIPYYLQAELNIMTSNLKHKYEILEQILLLFRPDLWFHTSEDPNDWTAINVVTLNDISLEEAYPAGTEPRILSTTLNFQFLAYMSAPVEVRENTIQKIKLRIKALEGLESFEDFAVDVASKIDPHEFDNIFDIKDLNPPEK